MFCKSFYNIPHSLQGYPWDAQELNKAIISFLRLPEVLKIRPGRDLGIKIGHSQNVCFAHIEHLLDDQKSFCAICKHIYK